MNKRLPWVWAAVLSCIFGISAPSLADTSTAASEACLLEEADGYSGLRRADAFDPGQVVLTFDDGPQPVATRRLLDALARYGYHATFFVVGQWIHRDTYSLIQRMAKEGHEIGTHTYSHDLALTRRGWGIDYIEGQYELGRIVIELALLAKSPDEFDRIHRRVIGHEPGAGLSPSQVRTEWHRIQDRHRELLSELGYGAGQRVYPILFARPPGGIPYEGHWPVSMQKQHEAALRRLGLLNVLWHGGSGDTVKSRLDDVGFLLGNIRHHTKKGGILLIHDRMRHDVLEAALERMSKDATIHVTTLGKVAASKYSCGTKELYATLHAVRNVVAARERVRMHEGS